MIEGWDDAVKEAKENLIDWNDFSEVVEEARGILRKKASHLHEIYLKSVRWIKLREEILKRDNFLCQDCSKIHFPNLLRELFVIPPYNPVCKRPATQVHHKDYGYLWSDQEKDYCISLCNLCHRLKHSSEYQKSFLITQIKYQLLMSLYYGVIESPQFIEKQKEIHNQYLELLTTTPQEEKFGEDGRQD